MATKLVSSRRRGCLGWKPAGLAACLLITLSVWGQAPQPAEKPAPGGAPAAAAPASPGAPAALDGPAALRHLNMAVAWYRHVVSDIQPLGLPSEVIYQEQAQSLAVQAVRLAFQSARSEAKLVAAQEAAAQAQTAGEGAAQRRAQAEARTAARVQELQAQAAALEAKIAATPAARRADLAVQLERTKSQLDLQQALLEAIRKMASFAASNGEAEAGLAGSVEQLARSIPEVLGQAGDTSKAGGNGTEHPTFSGSGGLLTEATTLYACMNADRQLKALIERTAKMRQLADAVRTPLQAALRATIQESQTLSDRQLPADGDASVIEKETRGDNALTDRFKQLVGALLPLSQEVMLLQDFSGNLSRWQELVQRASGFVMRSVIIRVSIIALALVVILGLSEAWRRVTFRYVKEARRRRQFLVLRRVVVGFLVAIVLILGLVTNFSSLATFAGFITAGIAVGLQAVLLSVAAYFLIIGRYGIRVGDRITIAGITGDVVDVGLVRFYLMELAGTGLEFRPTGRIVVFSNAVLFQAGTPLFKQIPGTEYAWHEVVMALKPEGDNRPAQEKLLAAVEEVYAGHRVEIERQHEAVERRGDIQVDAPHPEARIQFTDAGLELQVRYPVAIRQAREMDDQVTQKVLDLIAADPDLKATVSGTPKIRSLLKG